MNNSTFEVINELAHKEAQLKIDFINLQQASKLLGLKQEIILSDLGKNILTAEWYKNEWYFDRTD